VVQQIGGYELSEVLGVGSRTTVYRGTHRFVSGLQAAVKVLHPHLTHLDEVREELRREAALLARLRHPHIVRVLDFIEDGELCALVVDLVQGRSLRERLADSSEILSVRRVLRIFRTLAEALGHAHGMGLSHGLLEPSVIFITERDDVKLLDFGRLGALAEPIAEEDLPYLAPNTKSDRLQSTVHDDIYSLARIGEALLLGREVRARQASPAALEEAGAPAGLVDLLRQMGKTNEQERLGSCGELLDALDRLGGSSINRVPLETLDLGHCQVDLAREEVHLGEQHEGLTTNEASLLRYLATNPGRVITRDQLMRDVWGIRGRVVTRAVDVAVRRLRKKIEPNPAEPRFILTVHGQGYRFEPPSDEEPPVAPSPAVPEAPAASLATGGDSTQELSVITLDGRVVQGRERSLAALQELFETGARLVTLTGPGGMGKTLLARVFAEQRAPTLLGEASSWFCDLQAARDKEGMIRAVAAGLGIAMASTTADDDVEAISDELANRGPCLVLLDNFEQLVESSGEVVAAWLQAAPGARFLVTSQALLNVPGERVYELAPLDEEPAVALFMERARELRYDFQPDEQGMDDIRTVVKELDRIPLAVELAAARIRMLSTQQLRQRLTQRFELLRANRASDKDRTTTLRGAIEWSWQLLRVEEKHVLAQTTIFSGGFSAEAAEAVIEFPHGDALVLDLLQGLVDKSLLRCVEVPGVTGLRRFTFFESIYLFASEHLAELTSLGALKQRHRDYYLVEAERLAASRDGSRGLQATRLLELEIDNLLKIESECSLRESDVAVRIALVLEPILQERGPPGVYDRLLNSVLEHSGRQNPETQIDLLYARALWRRRVGGMLAEVEHDIELLESLARDSLRPLLLARASLYRAGGLLIPMGHITQAEGQVRTALLTVGTQGRPLDRLLAHQHMSHFAEWQGRMKEAEKHARNALEIASDSGLQRRKGNCLRRLGVLHCNLGMPQEAEGFLREAIEIHEAFDNPRSTYACLGLLAEVVLILGRHDEAERLVEESTRRALLLGDAVASAHTQGILGRIHLDLGNAPRAIRHLEAGRAGLAASGWAVGGAITQVGLAVAHLQLGAAEEASAQLAAAMEVLTAETQIQARLQALCVLAVTRARLSDPGGALESLTEAGQLAEAQGEVEQALCTVVAQQLDPAFSVANSLTAEQLQQLSKRSVELRLLLRLLDS